ncbi:MAG: putative protein YccU [Phycisphaerae bacterium]|nr:putative protein YccU [Phycisphaerae bacterium]
MKCEMPDERACDEMMRGLLRSARRIAVVGASARPQRDSYHIVEFLKEQGYTVLPVNPNYREVAGLTCFASLDDVGGPVDIVDVFRRPDAVDEVVDQAIRNKAGALWLQEGVINNPAARRACQAGLRVVQNRCIYKEHVALL